MESEVEELKALLWGIRAQLEAQLRHLERAQAHFIGLAPGSDGRTATQTARVVTNLTEVCDRSTAITGDCQRAVTLASELGNKEEAGMPAPSISGTKLRSAT